MRVVECSGTPAQLGEATGEALRDEIALNLDMGPRRAGAEANAAWQQRAPGFVAVLKRHLPHVLEEMRGTARGAGVDESDIFRLNLPLYPHQLTPADGGCTNFALAGGPDGPIWGKNNDGNPPARPVCARVVRPEHGIPQVTFTFCGMVATTDGMNAEGVAVGHSSVGSVYQQSDAFLPIRLWAYEVMMRARTTGDFVELMASTPLRGKGYSIVCVDRHGTACSVEAPCPLVQVRAPRTPQGVHCVNCYQLPHLAEADRRTPEGKADAVARWQLLDTVLAEAEPQQDTEAQLDLSFAKRLLRRHGDHDHPGLCRHGECQDMETEYSMIGLPAQGRVLFLEGHPCQESYGELTL